MEMTTDMQVAATSSCDQTVLSQQDASQSQKDPRNRSIQSPGEETDRTEDVSINFADWTGAQIRPSD